MDAILQGGLEFIAAVQRPHNPALDTLFRMMTELGNETFYLLALPFIFWCIDFRLGVRVAILLFLSGYLNLALKEWFQQPRPFHLDPSVKLADAPGYGFPSGHAQSAVVLWGTLAQWIQQQWAWAGALTLILLIGFSRIYLGVHFPTDVLAGWAIGTGFLVLYRILAEPSIVWLKHRPVGQQLSLAVAGPLLLALVFPTSETVTTMAVLVGVSLGTLLLTRYYYFNAGGPWHLRILRYLVGNAGILPLYLGFKLVLPPETSDLYLPLRFIQYSLIGMWVAFGAPALFQRLRLFPLPTT